MDLEEDEEDYEYDEDDDDDEGEEFIDEGFVDDPEDPGESLAGLVKGLWNEPACPTLP